MVQTVKNCLKKSKELKQNPQLALLALRTTPVDNILPSPAELLFNRKIQHQLPQVIQHNSKAEEVKLRLLDRQAVQKRFYDNGTRELPPLIPNQQVAIQDTNSGLWSPAKVVRHSEEPRSYVVETTDGATRRRNRRHLKDSSRTKQPIATGTDEHDTNSCDDYDHSGPVPTPTSNGTDNPTYNPGPTNTLRTRSGRTVRPPKRFGEEE